MWSKNGDRVARRGIFRGKKAQARLGGKSDEIAVAPVDLDFMAVAERLPAQPDHGGRYMWSSADSKHCLRLWATKRV